MKKRFVWHASAAALALALPDSAIASQADQTLPSADAAVRGSDIIVTARRREEKAQDVPIALSVVGQKQLEASGNYTLTQVQQLVPSLQIFALNPRNTNINIRGLGSSVAITNDGLENGVGVYVDNVYYGRVGQSQFDLVDLDRIEVLRGPQGTLFGKNTTAGAINITSRQPSFKPDFSGEVSGGDYGYHQVRASVAGGIVDDLAAFRLSFADTHRDGFIHNVRTGKDVQAYDNFSIRGQLLLTPTERLHIRLIGDYSHQNEACCVSLFAGSFTKYSNGAPVTNTIFDRAARVGYSLVPFDSFARRTDADAPTRVDMKGYGVSGQADYDLGGAALTSITAYRWWDWNPQNDSDATGLSIFAANATETHQRQFSQELRIASTGSRTIDWVAGVYYFWQTVASIGRSTYGSAAPDYFRAPTAAAPLSIYTLALNGFSSLNHSDPITHSYAGFGQATWHLDSRLSLTGGLRFTHEDKKGAFDQTTVAGADLSALPAATAAAVVAIRNGFAPTIAYSATRHDNALTGLATLSYKITPDVLTYASYARGNKSGGLNLTSLPIGVNVPTTVKPETVNAYELGIKSQLFDHRLLLNLAAFWTDISNFQSAITTQTNLGTSLQYLQNVGKARSRGIEADSTLQLAKRVSVNASLAYVDAYYRSYPNAPAPTEISNVAAATDLSGQPAAGAPRWTYTLGGDAAQPIGQFGSRELQIYGHADYSHRSSYFTQVTNSIYSRAPAYGILNARLGLRTDDQRWDVSVWMRNLTNKDYFQIIGGSNTGQITGTTGDPRTFGGTIRTKF